MSQPPLTRRQRDILEYLTGYLEENGISPTLEEIAQHFGVSRVTVFGHVQELQRKGAIERGAPGHSRTLRPVQSAVAEGDRAAAAGVAPEPLRILGQIAAGAPIEALEDPEELDLGGLVPRDRDVYALRVRGDSMIEDAICDGDIVLVERRSQARDGETVVAVLEGEEATLKRLYRERGGFRLQPANATLEPLHVTSLEIRGVVIGVVRQL